MKASGSDILESNFAGQILNDLDDAILVTNSALCIEFANKPSYSLLRKSEPELTCRHLTDLFPELKAVLPGQYKAGQKIKTEITWRFNEAELSLRLVLSPVFKDNNNNQFFGLLVRISEVSIPEEEKYKALFKDVQEGIIVMDDTSAIVEVNPAACAIFEIDSAEFIKLRVRNIFPHNSDSESDRLWVEFIKKGRLSGFYKFLLKSGKYRYIEFKATTNFMPGLHLAIFIDVTEKRNAQNALKVSESQLKAIFNSTSQLIILLDLNFRILQINKMAGMHIFQFTGRKDVIGYSIYSFLDEIIDQGLGPGFYVERVLRGEAASFECRLKSFPDCWYEVTITPVYDKYLKINSLCVSALDVSLRKRAELSLASSEARFRSLVQNSNDLITILSPQGKILYLGSSLYKILGYKDKDLANSGLFDLVIHDDVPVLKNLLREVIKNNEDSYALEFKIRHAEGYYIHLEAIFNNQLDNSFINGIIMNARDITMRKLQEENLRLLERAIDSSENGILITDPGKPGNPLIYVNKAFKRITGFDWTDMIGKNMDILMGEETDPNLHLSLGKAMETGKGISMLMKNYRKDGIPFWNDLTISPVFNSENNLTNFIGVINDVTEKKNAEDALKEIISGLASVSEQEFFETLVRYLSWSVRSDIIFITEVTESGTLWTKAFLYDGTIIPDMELIDRDAPWYRVVDEKKTIYVEDMNGGFPSCEHIPEGFTCFLGVPLLTSSGTIVGVLGAVNRGNFQNLPFLESLLNLFSVRTSAELERQQYMKSLKESEEKFRALAENSPDLILIYNLLERKVEYINKSHFLGYTDKELSDTNNWLGTYHEEDQAQVMDYLLKTIKGQSDSEKSIDLRLRRKDGVYEWATNCISILEKAGKWTKRILINVNVITERKKAEEALRESEDRLKALTENTNDLLFSVDSSLAFSTMNTAFVNFMKQVYSKKVEIGQSAAHVFTSELFNSEWAKLIRKSLKNKRLVKEINVNPAFGNESFEVLFNPICSEGLEVRGVSVFARDITRRKKAENDIKRANFELDSFVYRASHDLRAPLRSVMGLISLVKMESSDEQRDEYLNLANKSIIKLDSFIGDLTDFSRNSRMEINFKQIDLNAVIDDTVERLQFMEKAHRITIYKNLEPDSMLFSDQTRVSIIIQNLLSNAIKYQNEYAESSYCEVGFRHLSHREVEIWVTDNGKGIKKELQNRVFDMFFRASHDSYGSGLGLYITKQVVEKLNGTITLKSIPGQGTSFFIILPVQVTRAV